MILFNASKFVLLDEPFSGLPPKMIEKVVDLIKENALQKGIFVTDHNYRDEMDIATNLLLLKDGKLNKINEKAELFKKNV